MSIYLDCERGKVVQTGRKKTWKWNQKGALPTGFVFVVFFIEWRSVCFSGLRIPLTRSVLPASFCNVNVVDFCSGSTWFETQLELLVSLRGIVSQSLPVRTSNWRLPLSNPYASSVISRPVTLNEPICYSTKCHSTTISLISSAINRFSSRCRVLSRILSEKSLALLTGHWLFHR